jgi:hypothetical protein
LIAFCWAVEPSAVSEPGAHVLEPPLLELVDVPAVLDELPPPPELPPLEEHAASARAAAMSPAVRPARVRFTMSPFGRMPSNRTVGARYGATAEHWLTSGE